MSYIAAYQRVELMLDDTEILIEVEITEIYQVAVVQFHLPVWPMVSRCESLHQIIVRTLFLTVQIGTIICRETGRE